MDLLGPWHLLIVAIVFIALFGAKRLPEAARSLGKSARILKSELKDSSEEHPASPPVVAAPVAVPQVVVPPVAPPVAEGTGRLR